MRKFVLLCCLFAAAFAAEGSDYGLFFAKGRVKTITTVSYRATIDYDELSYDNSQPIDTTFVEFDRNGQIAYGDLPYQLLPGNAVSIWRNSEGQISQVDFDPLGDGSMELSIYYEWADGLPVKVTNPNPWLEMDCELTIGSDGEDEAWLQAESSAISVEWTRFVYDTEADPNGNWQGRYMILVREEMVRVVYQKRYYTYW